jgi:hypothetical protein
MKVISNRNTTRLVKGASYEVLEINTLPDGSRYFRPTIRLKVASSSYRFSPIGFKNLDGTPIGKVSWKSSELKNKSTDYSYINDVRLVSKGDVVVCKRSSKKFDAGKMYKVDEILYKKETRPRTSGSGTYDSIEQKIKTEGYNRWLNPYAFRLCTPQEKRTLSLCSIFEDETVNVCSDFSTRKIDRLDEKQKNRVILNSVIASLFDPNKNTLSTIEWAVQKKGKQYDLEEKDIKPFLNKKLSDLIKMCE